MKDKKYRSIIDILNKNEIVKELKNEKFIVRDNIYEYVCKLHLYDDKDINAAFIEFLETNYNQKINYCGLIYSKLNEEIIELLIAIHDKEEDLCIKSKIEKVLVSHYSIIKNMDYNFEELIKDKDCLIMGLIQSA